MRKTAKESKLEAHIWEDSDTWMFAETCSYLWNSLLSFHNFSYNCQKLIWIEIRDLCGQALFRQPISPIRIWGPAAMPGRKQDQVWPHDLFWFHCGTLDTGTPIFYSRSSSNRIQIPSWRYSLKFRNYRLFPLKSILWKAILFKHLGIALGPYRRSLCWPSHHAARDSLCWWC